MAIIELLLIAGGKLFVNRKHWIVRMAKEGETDEISTLQKFYYKLSKQ